MGKSGFIFCLFFVLGAVFAAGCLGDNSSAQWDYEVSAIYVESVFVSGAPGNVPTGEGLIQYKYNALPKNPQYSSLHSLFTSDYYITARVIEIKPAVWSTADGKIPSEIAGSLTYTDQKGTVQIRNEISGDEYIYTVIRFENFDHNPKIPDQFDVKIYGGQVDNVVMAESVGFPNAWDLEVGKLYQVMLKSDENEGEYVLLPSSLTNTHYRRAESIKNSPELNPKNVYLARYLQSDANVPTGSDIEFYNDFLTFEPIDYPDEGLISESDLAFYGTVKKVNPSVWSTPDGKDPDNSSFYQQYPEAELGKGAEFIYTTFVFEVDDLVKGNASGDVTVFVRGGQEGKYVQYASIYYPTIWDIREGDTYLVYLKEKPHSKYYEIMYGGLFIADYD